MLNHPEQRELPDADDLRTNPRLRLALSLAVMDGTGTVRAMRFMTVSPEVSRRVALLHEQGLREWVDAAEWDREIARFNARYPSPGDAMRDAVTCKGGD